MAERPQAAPPKISVVIPVRNEEEAVVGAIVSALEQVGAPPLEVIVADGSSIDGTRAAVSAVAHDDSRLRLVGNPAATTPAGLNAAIRESHGDVIVRCDAHSILPRDYVATALRVLEGTGADVVGGTMRAVGSRFWQRAIAMALTTPVGVGDARFHTGGPPGPVDTVYLGVFRRGALERVGLFDESLERNQDYELNYRIRESGGEVYFDPKLAVDYVPRRGLMALARQYRQYGMWKRLVLRRFPESLRWRQLAAPLLVVGLIASVVMLLLSRPVLAAIVPGTYVLALVASAVVELARRRDVAALALPLVLPTMHLSWAFGFMTSDLTDPGPNIPELSR
jgi:glycosyltransferase involved in cell wall biosynthesis